jgi:hypothetical protein
MAANQVGTARGHQRVGVVDEKQEDLIKMGFGDKLRKRQSFRSMLTMLFECTTNS